MIRRKKCKTRSKLFFFFTENQFVKTLPRDPKFEYPPLLTRPFIPRTLSKLLEGTLLKLCGFWSKLDTLAQYDTI